VFHFLHGCSHADRALRSTFRDVDRKAPAFLYQSAFDTGFSPSHSPTSRRNWRRPLVLAAAQVRRKFAVHSDLSSAKITSSGCFVAGAFASGFCACALLFTRLRLAA